MLFITPISFCPLRIIYVNNAVDVVLSRFEDFTYNAVTFSCLFCHLKCFIQGLRYYSKELNQPKSCWITEMLAA